MNKTLLLFTLITLLCLNNKSYSQNHSYKCIDIKTGLSQMKVSSICEDSLGYVWIGTRNGLNRYNGDKIKVFSIQNGLPSNRILALAVDSTNRLLVLTSKGLSFYNGANFKTFYKEFPRVHYNMKIQNGYVHITDLDNNWKFKNGNFNNEIDGKIDPTFDVLEMDYIVQTHNKLAFNLNGQHDTIYDANVDKIIRPASWFRDKGNNFWIGSDNGVHLFEPDLFSETNYVKIPSIWSIWESKDTIWLGSYGSGIYKMSYKDNKKLTHVKQDKSLVHYHQGTAENREGNIFFSNGSALVKYENGKFKSIRAPSPSFGVTYDSERSIIICGTLGGIMLVGEDDQLKIINDSSLVHKNHYIMSITVDQESNYWLGSYSGLTRLNIDSNESEFFLAENGKLPKGQGVFTGLKDSYDNLWFGGDKGLLIYSKLDQALINIESQLLNTQVKAIIEIDSTKLLINTKDQLIVFNHFTYLSTGKIETTFINESNSYKGYEPGFDGLFKDSREYIWVLSGATVDILDPKRINYDTEELNVIFTNLNGQVPTTNLKKPFQDTITISNEKTISFEVDVIGKVRPSYLKYRYKLNNAPWKSWSKSSNFQIKNITHGKHVIEVEVGPTDRIPNNQVAKIYVDVKLDINNRAFFIPLILICLLCAFILLCYYLFKSRSERKLYLRQLEESRYLKSQLLLSEMNPHFIFNVLASIQNKILLGDKESANHKLIQLSSLMRNFLLTSYIGNQPKKAFENEITIKREIELLTSYLDFEKSNSNGQITYLIKYSNQFDIDQIMIPPMIIQPYVENAVKHGILPKGDIGSIQIFFELFSDRLVCKVIDNGVGFQPIPISSMQKNRHQSLGSKLVRERVKLLNDLGYNISIETKSKIGIGTEVKIIIIDKF